MREAKQATRSAARVLRRQATRCVACQLVFRDDLRGVLGKAVRREKLFPLPMVVLPAQSRQGQRRAEHQGIMARAKARKGPFVPCCSPRRSRTKGAATNSSKRAGRRPRGGFRRARTALAGAPQHVHRGASARVQLRCPPPRAHGRARGRERTVAAPAPCMVRKPIQQSAHNLREQISLSNSPFGESA